MTSGFSGDGYIIDQEKMGAYQYGKFTSDYNGCGWIALYNLLHSMDFAFSPDDARKLCLTKLPLEGRMGTPTKSVIACLDKLNIKTQLIKGKKNVIASIGNVERGILRFFDGEYDHYVAFVPDKLNMYRFFNSDPTKEYDITTMASFLNTRCKLPFVKLIAVVKG